MSDVHPVQTHRPHHERGQVSSRVTERAYEVYSSLYGTSQSLARLNERGGFGASELIAFLYARSFPKDEWPHRVAEASKGHDRPMTNPTADAIAALTHDERQALDAWHKEWSRLDKLGWRDLRYAPHDGSQFLVIEAGSCGVFRGRYLGEWPQGGVFAKDGGDLYPVSAGLFRKERQ